MNLTLSATITSRNPTEIKKMKQAIDVALKLNQEEIVRVNEKSETLSEEANEWFTRSMKAETASRTVTRREGEDDASLEERIATLVNLHLRATEAMERTQQERKGNDQYVEELKEHAISLREIYNDLDADNVAEVITKKAQQAALITKTAKTTMITKIRRYVASRR